MSSLNNCFFIGYMAADPESRAMANGDMVTNFRIACGERWKDKNTGEMKEKTEWISCVAWRGLAKIVNDYGRKGMQVFVSGKMTTRKWTDKNQVDRWTTEIQADEFKMLGKKNDSERQDTTEKTTGGHPVGTSVKENDTGFDDDIPFAAAWIYPLTGLLLSLAGAAHMAAQTA